ncbi:hypothetical protein UM93_06000 [Psychromicrobium lacuslunae]|uniref:C4-dicarboxylate ABC transporter substrate-binding protein n=1 Tax=Psychromicrobium lacuslunae TaxID=1618207 RepID=A0A0D4C3G3_9MICC|nr:hypothetical protein UM93_06000 [Psychromicrobium lacuslunae]
MIVAATLAVALTTAPAVALAQSPNKAPGAEAVTDTDGDGLPDLWETDGYDSDGDGVIDVDLPALGADPRKKDIFVETDYLPGELPSVAVYDKIVQIFADAPVQNPDGSTGINIHLDAGSAAPAARYNLGGGNEIANVTTVAGVSTVANAKSSNLAAARKPIFRYMWWADKYGSGSSSGQGYQPGDTFLVTVGKTYWKNISDDGKAGTFVHELGHTLGLGHGGGDNINRKPNYLSILNYAYQIDGIPLSGGGKLYSYSSTAAATLNESALDESAGLGAAGAGFKTSYKNGLGKTVVTSGDASGPIDWNGNGVIDAAPVSVDINGEGGNQQSLAGYDDWSHLRYKAGAVGASSGAIAERSRAIAPQLVSNELTAELYAKISRH